MCVRATYGFHTITSKSKPPETSRRYSGEYERQRTPLVCPSSVRLCLPVCRSHRPIVQSIDADASISRPASWSSESTMSECENSADSRSWRLAWREPAPMWYFSSMSSTSHAWITPLVSAVYSVWCSAIHVMHICESSVRNDLASTPVNSS